MHVDVRLILEGFEDKYPEEYLLLFTESRRALTFAAGMGPADMMNSLSKATRLAEEGRVKEALGLVVGPERVPRARGLDGPSLVGSAVAGREEDDQGGEPAAGEEGWPAWSEAEKSETPAGAGQPGEGDPGAEAQGRPPERAERPLTPRPPTPEPAWGGMPGYPAP